MEIIFCGVTTELDDLNWRSEILDVRKRILSIVSKGGLLDSVINDSQSAGAIDFYRLILNFLDFELKCEKLTKDLTADERARYLENIDIENEFTTRYESLGISNDERVRLCLYVIEQSRKWEEKKILMDDIGFQPEIKQKFAKLLTYLELVHTRLQGLKDAGTRQTLMKVCKEIKAGLTQSQDDEYLDAQQDIIREVEERLITHLELVAVMKKINHEHQDGSASEFLRTGIDLANVQRQYLPGKINGIDNDLIFEPLSAEFDEVGRDLEYLSHQLV